MNTLLPMLSLEASTFAFKLAMAPILMAGATWAVRRWGERIGGLIIGLPLTSGPISFFLAVERGPAFALDATAGSLIAALAQTAFCLTCLLLLRRGLAVALTVSTLNFALIGWVLTRTVLPQAALFAGAIVAVHIALRCSPPAGTRLRPVRAPRWDLPARMLLMVSLVLGVTRLAPYAGPAASGVIASFPFMAVIVAVFAHVQSGEAGSTQVLRGLLSGLYGFAAFFFVLSMALAHWSLASSYGAAVLSALCIQAWVLRGFAAR